MPEDEAIYPSENIYNESITGPSGRMGGDSSVNIHYVLGTLKPSKFDRVQLICDIPGSEKWPISQLFQRDVNEGNVKGIIEWLKEPSGYKFFNPLTLTLLPVNSTGQMNHDLPTTLLDGDSFFQLEALSQNASVGTLRWDSSQAKLVAIDGQHRFTALSRLAKNAEFRQVMENWEIPIVIFVPVVSESLIDPPSWIDVSRQVFYNINTKSNEVSSKRKILLNNNCIYSIATQELLQAFHVNDYQSINHRSLDLPPLYLFDWRDDPFEGSQRVSAYPSPLFGIEEVKSWMEEYLLGLNPADTELALSLSPGEQLQIALQNNSGWSHDTTDEARKKLSEDFIPSLVHLLSEIEPLKDCSRNYRNAEQAVLGNNFEAASIVFEEMRYGGTGGGDQQQRQDADAIRGELRRELNKIPASTLPRIFRNDIGLRGVMAAFAMLKHDLGDLMPQQPRTWVEYSKWFVEAINNTKDNSVPHPGPDQWPLFGAPNSDDVDFSPTVMQKRYFSALKHLAFDHNEKVGSSLYRHSSVRNALGRAYSLVILSKAYKLAPAQFDESEYRKYVETVLQELEENSILNGYKKELRPQIKEDLGGSAAIPKQVNEKTSELASEYAQKQRDIFQELIFE